MLCCAVDCWVILCVWCVVWVCGGVACVELSMSLVVFGECGEMLYAYRFEKFIHSLLVNSMAFNWLADGGYYTS